MTASQAIDIRPAQPGDEALVMRFIRELADYERLAHEVVADETAVRASLFGDQPAAAALLAYHDGQPAGLALYFHNYSTFLGRQGLYLEDLYVTPELRGHGIGLALLRRLAAIAVERGCGRMEWAVLNWNEPAIRFYKQLGARAQDEWQVYRLTGESLSALANE